MSHCVRLIQLMEEIMAEKENKTIIFVETKKRCDDLTRRMRRDGWELTAYSCLIIVSVKSRESVRWSSQRVELVFFNVDLFNRWPAMCIHGDKSQPERDWVLTGQNASETLFSFDSFSLLQPHIAVYIKSTLMTKLVCIQSLKTCIHSQFILALCCCSFHIFYHFTWKC